MTAAPGSMLLHYRLAERIGQGGMGEVWRATDTILGREVALKILPASFAADPERLQRFEREAKLLASLNNPGIAAIYGLHEHNGVRFLAMELVPGEDLAERLARGPMGLEQALAIARQMAEAIEAAHEQGVIHRDLKPANVKLTPEGNVKVLDFGLAKALDPMISSGGSTADGAMSPTITSLGTIAGVILGTAAYMSPEQARGAKVDRRADIWSFGAVLWEMLTGKRAFEGETVSDTLASVLRAPIEWDTLPASTPPGIVRLLKRCLERDPKKRLRDIGEARIAIDTAGSEPAMPAVSGSVSAAPKRAILPWALFASAALAAIVFAVPRRAPVAEHRVVKFQIAAAEKMTGMNWPRLSPDGKRLAFRARGASGRTTIWVRSLDAIEPQELAGTEGAGRPWWSPDGRYLAFFAGTQLKKVPATGGPAQLIAEADGGADGAWGKTGTILFDGRAIDPIRRVASSGGHAAPETTLDATKDKAGHAWPFFLPDGEHFLFVGMSRSPNEKSTVMVGSLGKHDYKSITPTSSRVEYANGYILYVLDNTLVAQQFDPGALAVTGEPVPVAEHVESGQNGDASFSVSSDGTLSYVAGGATADSRLVWLDRNGHEIGAVGDPAAYRDVTLSPDGKRLAYGKADPRSGSEDVWVRDLERGVASRLTFEETMEVLPVWSPDGEQIAYASNATGHFSLVVKKGDGTGEARPIFGDGQYELGPSDWSRDGRWVAISMLPASRRWQIRMLPMQGAPVPVDYLVQNVSQLGARFSPDGRYVAYSSNDTGTSEIYVQSFPLGGGKWQISSGGGQDATWRADGKEIFYRTATGDFYVVPVTTSPRFEPGIAKLLFKQATNRDGIVGFRWSVTADGQRFLVNASNDAQASNPFTVVLDWPATLAANPK